MTITVPSPPGKTGGREPPVFPPGEDTATRRLKLEGVSVVLRRKDKITSRPPSRNKFQITVASQVKGHRFHATSWVSSSPFFQLSRPEKDRPYPTLPLNFCCDVTSFLFRYFRVSWCLDQGKISRWLHSWLHSTWCGHSHSCSITTAVSFEIAWISAASSCR